VGSGVLTEMNRQTTWPSGVHEMVDSTVHASIARCTRKNETVFTLISSAPHVCMCDRVFEIGCCTNSDRTEYTRGILVRTRSLW